MNYQSIWKGEDYAWAQYRSKGSFPRNGKKCRVLDKRKITYSGNERQSSEVLIEYEHTDYYSKETKTIQKWVPAREIVDFWDNYSSELEHILEEAKERAERYEAERLERKRLREEEKAREEAEKEQRFVDFSTRTGIPREAIIILGEENVTITISALQERLGLNQWAAH
jgi:hypothetical protein